MWVSDRWTDYELIDCGRGEKLERWGDQLLVRPDPQAIWNTPRTHPGWKHPHGRYARSSSGGGQWEKKDMPERWTISLRQPHLQHQAHEFQAHRPLPGAGGQLGLGPRADPSGRDGPSGCSICSPTPAEPRWPAPPPGPACATWTPPGAWCPVGPGERQELRTGGRSYPLDRG